MTKQSDRRQDRIIFSEPSPQQNVSWWRRGLVASLIFGLGTIVVGKVAGNYLIQNELIPLVETELNDYLDRPIDIGDLKSFSLNSARFGKTILPATEDNPDWAEVSGVEVNFNLLPLLLEKRLPLSVTLVRPNLYIEQDTERVWTPTNFGTGDSAEGGIKVNVKQINLQQGTLTLVGRNSVNQQLNNPVTAEFKKGVVKILESGDLIKFSVGNANLVEGGRLNVTGEVVNKVVDLDIKAQEVAVNQIEDLLALPIGLESGKVDGDLAITITDEPIPELRGTAQLKQVDLQVPGLKTPLSNSNGSLFFNGSRIELDRVKANFGTVIGTANGFLDLAGEDNFQITADTVPTEADRVLDALKLESPVPITGKIQTNVKLTGSLDNPVAQVAIATTSPTRIDRTDFKQVRGNLELIGNTLYVRSFRGVPRSGGNITGTGTVGLDGAQNLYFNVSADNVSAKELAKDYQTTLPVEIGAVSGNAVISAQANDPSSFRIVDGEGNFPLGNGIVTLENLKYRSGKWRSQIRASDVRFDSLPFGGNTTETIGAGLVSGTFNATGEINDPQLDTLVATGTATVDTVGGRIVAPEIKVNDGIWEGDFNTSNLQLRQLFPEVPPEFSDSVSGEFYLTGDVSTPAGEASTIEGRGDLQLASGTINVSQLNVTGNDWKAIATANDLELKQLNSATPEQFAGLVNGNFTLSGTVDNITPEGIVARGDGSLTLPEGVFAANNLSIANGNFTTTIIPQGVDLALFADPDSEDFILEGYLGGELQASGSIDKIDPTAIDARGTVSFSQGIDLLDRPFSANIVWNGSRLDVLQAKGDALAATGYIELDETFFDAIPDKLAAVDYFNFDVTRANGIDINRLKVPLPSWAINLEKSGIVDFTGEISGIPAQIAIDGDATLRNFNVETLEFDEPLTGTVVVNPNTGVDLALFNNQQPALRVVRVPWLTKRQQGRTSTNNQQITLKLDADFSPQSFTIVNDDLSIEGTGKAEIVELIVSNVPLELIRTIAVKSPDFEVPDKWAVQPLAGELSGSFVSNLNTLATSGKNVVITSPLLGKIRGNRIVGDFQYADNYLALQNVQFQLGESIYQLTGDLVQQNDDIELDGTVSVAEGEIQDILTALEIFEITDFGNIFGDRNYAKSADLYQPPATPPIEEPLFNIEAEDASVWEQLSILAQIQAWLRYNEQQRQEESILPQLSNLRGIFDGEIQVNGSLSNGFNAEFAFEGEKWKWRRDRNNSPEETANESIIAEKILLRGDLQDNIVTVLPLIIDLPSGLESESQIIFSGIFGGEEASGTLALDSIPIDLIETVFPLPPEIAFDGVLSATANISGTSDNPQARGEITIADAQINETAIQKTSGSFGYDDARLNFSANSIVAEDAEPLTITGSVPYQLPFAQVSPESDRLEISLNVRDKALTLLNILSRGEVNWIDGGGEVALDISGSYNPETNIPDNITAQGTAFIENGTIAVRTLPDEYLTEVNSNISFDLDRITVENFQGNFGGGEISAIGTIPIDKETPQENPLTIDLEEIAVDLKGLYQGGIRGQLQILGQAIEPDITGNVTLFDGTILLSDASATTSVTPQQQQQLGLPAVTEYQNLQLKLGDDIVISQPPIFNFVAEGTLDVDGTFLEPLPEGTINLKRGQVNLFTTQLYLAKTEDNTARFTPNNILDPFLDVRLVGSAIEATQNRTPEDPLSSEIEDIPASSFGTIETVRIYADVRGLSSQIANNILLTSSPPRSQTEILALLGGSFVNTLGRGNSTLGLANLAGSALFGSLNSQFNNAFPIGELRLFPTQIIDEDSESERIDALAGEIAIDITNDFSFSVLKILNVGEIPAQFGFRYRIDENFVLRGSSNFEDESRGVLEYELRF